MKIILTLLKTGFLLLISSISWGESSIISTDISTSSIIIRDANGTGNGVAVQNGRMFVSIEAPPAPPGTVSIIRSTYSILSTNESIDDFYTITDGSTLTISQMGINCSGGSGTNKYIRLELFEDQNGNLSILNRIRTIFCTSLNYESAISRNYIGNGIRRILMRTTQVSGASMEAERFWRGFED